MLPESAAAHWQRRLEDAAPGLVDRCSLVARRPRSVILRGNSPAFGEVCIKYDPSPAGRGRIEAEYHALLAYGRAAGPSGPFGCPDARALVQDPLGGAALVMSWVRCPRADDRLARSLPFDSVRGQVLHRAAGWLAHFHRFGRLDDRPLRSALDLSRLEQELRRALDPREPSRRDPDLDALRDTVRRRADTSVRFATIHDDFLPQNLLLCAGRTLGTDFTLGVAGPALRDAGCFLANIVWRGYSTLDPSRWGRFERDVKGFLETYYGGMALPERTVARFFILAELAGKANALTAKIAGRRVGTSDRLHRMMIVGAIRHLLRCDRLDASGAPPR